MRNKKIKFILILFFILIFFVSPIRFLSDQKNLIEINVVQAQTCEPSMVNQPGPNNTICKKITTIYGPGQVTTEHRYLSQTEAEKLDQSKGIVEKPQQKSQQGNCGWFNIVCDLIQAILINILDLAGKLLYFAGTVLNAIVSLTVINMGSVIRSMTVINDIWTVCRDLANIVFIFLLIYIAIRTILGLASGQIKGLLVRLIMVALLINFSLFFTKVIIDSGNLVAFQFYRAMTGGQQTGGTAWGELGTGISWAFMAPLQLTSIFSTNPGGSLSLSKKTDEQDDAYALRLRQERDKAGEEFRKTLNNNFSTIIMATLFILIAAFVFFAIAIMLIIRFVVLVFLMVTSPLAYIGGLLPKGNDFASRWWSTLINQTILAPVLMMCLWMTARIIQSDGFKELLNGRGDFAAALTSGIPETIVVIASFLVIIGFLLASMVAAKSLGAMGADVATKWAGKASFGLSGFAGRQTVGRLSRYLAERTKGWSGNAIGKGVNMTLRGIGNRSFDARGLSAVSGVAGAMGASLGEAGGKGGYQATFERRVKAKQEYADYLGEKKVFNQEEKEAIKQLGKEREGKQEELNGINKMLGESQRSLTLGKKGIESILDKFNKRIAALNAEKTRIEATPEAERGMRERERLVEIEAERNAVNADITNEMNKKPYKDLEEKIRNANDTIKINEEKKYQAMAARNKIDEQIKSIEKTAPTLEAQYHEPGKISAVWDLLAGGTAKEAAKKYQKEQAKKTEQAEKQEFRRLHEQELEKQLAGPREGLEKTNDELRNIAEELIKLNREYQRLGGDKRLGEIARKIDGVQDSAEKTRLEQERAILEQKDKEIENKRKEENDKKKQKTDFENKIDEVREEMRTSKLEKAASAEAYAGSATSSGGGGTKTTPPPSGGGTGAGGANPTT